MWYRFSFHGRGRCDLCYVYVRVWLVLWVGSCFGGDVFQGVGVDVCAVWWEYLACRTQCVGLLFRFAYGGVLVRVLWWER